MNAEVELTFVPTISIGGGDLIPIALPQITERIKEIIAHVVDPAILESVQMNGMEIVAKVFLNNADVYAFLEDVSYYLTDDQILQLGIAPPKGINSVGQDTWAQGDITLDEETLIDLRMSPEEDVEFIPILIGYNIFFLA